MCYNQKLCKHYVFTIFCIFFSSNESRFFFFSNLELRNDTQTFTRQYLNFEMIEKVLNTTFNMTKSFTEILPLFQIIVNFLGLKLVNHVLFVHFWSAMHPVVLLVIEMIINDGTYKMRSLKGVKIMSDWKIIGLMFSREWH